MEMVLLGLRRGFLEVWGRKIKRRMGLLPELIHNSNCIFCRRLNLKLIVWMMKDRLVDIINKVHKLNKATLRSIEPTWHSQKSKYTLKAWSKLNRQGIMNFRSLDRSRKKTSGETKALVSKLKTTS